MTTTINIRGLLTREPSPFGSDYIELREEIESTLARGDDVVLDVDSHGGDLIGVKALADFIFSHRDRITAHVSGVCASAAYYIASAAGHISAPEDAIIGSVGTIGWPPDIGDAKVATLSPLKNSGDDLQGLLDDGCERFLRDVARYRGFSGSLEEVATKVGAGAMLTARDALSHQLIDEVKSMDDDINKTELDDEGISSVLTTMAETVKRLASENEELRAKVDSADERIGLLEQRLDAMKGAEEEAPAAECDEELKSEGEAPLEEEEKKEDDELMACVISTFKSKGLINAEQEAFASKLAKRDPKICCEYLSQSRPIVPGKMSISAKGHAPVAKTRHEKTLQRMQATGEDYAHALAYCIGKENK